MTNDYITGVWDFSNQFLCPYYVSFPHYLDADPAFVATTGQAAGWGSRLRVSDREARPLSPHRSGRPGSTA